MKIFLRSIVVLTLLSSLAACATYSNELSLKKITPSQRIYVGKMTVTLNGVVQPKCEIYLNYDITPSIKLAPNGDIYFKTDRQNLRFRKIACLQKIERNIDVWHMYSLPIEGVIKNEDQLVATYFGHIQINWTVNEDDTRVAVEAEGYSPTKKEIKIEESGIAKVTITSELSKSEKDFFMHIPQAQKRGYKLHEKLITIKTR